MFNGSEHYDGEWFIPLDEVGATDVNGTTWFDRTNYFQTVPTPALERILWLESDRMGHLLGAVTQKKLDNQRGVVQNEKRQGDNAPYGRSEYATLAGLLPAGHPYRHSTIGSMADLDAATLDDVKNWFKEYYGAANTVLVLAGDIDAATAKPLVEKYFGHIDAGPPVTRMKANAPQLEVNKFEIMYDQVPQERIDRNWIAPGRTTKDSVLLQLAAEVLGGGKTSRLYQRLVYELEIATRATASLQAQELLGFYSVTVDAKKEADRERVLYEMESVIDDFLRRGPTRQELDRAKTAIRAGVLRGLEKVGGFGGKAGILAQGELYAGDPDFILKQLKWLDAATPKEVLAAAKSVMNAGFYQLSILPYPEYKVSDSTVDRTKGVPAVPSTPDLSFPTIEETTLSNGMKVALAQRSAVPIVEFAIQFDAGYAADAAAGGRLGAASFTGSMLDEGTKSRSALEIAEELDALGATLGTGSTLDTTSVSLSALKDNLWPSLDLLSDVIRNPVFEGARLTSCAAVGSQRSNRKKQPPFSWRCACFRLKSTAQTMLMGCRSPARARPNRSQASTETILFGFISPGSAPTMQPSSLWGTQRSMKWFPFWKKRLETGARHQHPSLQRILLPWSAPLKVRSSLSTSPARRNRLFSPAMQRRPPALKTTWPSRP